MDIKTQIIIHAILCFSSSFIASVLSYVFYVKVDAIRKRNEKSNTLMSWDEYKSNPSNDKNSELIETNIACPKCGGKVYKDVSQVLTTFPVKYRYRCKNCSWWDVYF